MSAPPQAGPEIFDRGVDVRLLAVAGAAWAGVLIGLQSETTVAWSLMGIALIAAFAVLLVGRMITAVAVLATCAIGVGVGVGAQTKFLDSPIGTAEDGSGVNLTGVVVSDPKKLDNSFGERGSYITTLEGKEGWRTTLRISRSVDGFQGLIRGSKLRVTGTFEPFPDAKPPHTGVVSAERIEVLGSAGIWMRGVERIKTELSSLTASRGGEDGALISGMALGDDRELSPETKEAMLITSLTHLTAISGSHIALALAFLRVVLPIPRKAMAVVTWVFLVVVVVVVGPTPSVVRATLMGGLAAWGMLMRRSSQSLQLLATVTLVAVLVNPWSALRLGFALSTAATFGILTLGAALTKITREWLPEEVPGRRVLLSLGDAAAIAVSAQVATLPILALIEPWLPFWGVVANLAVAPLVAPLTLLGMAAAVFILPAKGVATVLVKVAAPLATALGFIARSVAAWPLAELPWPQGTLGFALALLWAAPLVAMAILEREAS